jgi:hypothetical protein
MEAFLERLILPFNKATDPQQIQAKFNRLWQDILNESLSEVEHIKNTDMLLLNNKSLRVKRYVQDTMIPSSLNEMAKMLLTEHLKSSADDALETGICTEIFLNKEMLKTLVALSQFNVPTGFRNEVLEFASV